MKYLSNCCVTGLIGLLAVSAVQARDLGEGAVNDSPSRALRNSEHFYEIWSGVGRLSLPSGETCSAVLLDTRNRQGQASGPAYLLTSGHCVLFEYGSARTDMPMTAAVTFHYFHDVPQRMRQYPIRTALWSSLVGTDLAVLEIDATLASLIQAGINPLKLASHLTYERQDALNVGAPVGLAEDGLRMSACAEQSAGTFIDHPGVFPLAMKNSCDLGAGSSGSPMLNRRTNEITGIVSKVAMSRSMPVPPDCEHSTSCTAARFNYTYAANFLYACFIDGVFTRDAANCLLEAVELTVVQPWKLKSRVQATLNADGQAVLPRWDFRFSLDAPFYRYKTVRNARDCQAANDYSAAIRTENAYINSEIGPQNGAYALCIVGVASGEPRLTRAMLNNVFTHAVYLSATPEDRTQAVAR